MVGWIPIGLLATLSRSTNAEIMTNRPMATELIKMVRELSALAQVQGIDLEDFGPYQVATWNSGTLSEAVGDVRQSSLAKSRSSHSALRDMRSGLRTEISASAGPLLAQADEFRLHIPTVRAHYNALLSLEKSR
jgi:ketopantoate reductase